MLSSNGTQATIQYFLSLIKAQSPEVAPSIFMTDRDQAQVNSIWVVFPECRRVFYCWWHVLWAIRTHFNTKEFPELWTRIKDWVRVTDQTEFDACWKYISAKIHRSPQASPITLLVIGSPTRRCGLRCHAKIGQSLKKEIQICYWKRMLSRFYHLSDKTLLLISNLI
jgi:hypothetical protein